MREGDGDAVMREIRELGHVTRAMDSAYRRGFEEGRDSVSALPVLLGGVVAGALSMLAWVTLF